MKVTSISVQTNNPDRVNVSIDGRYRFSLDFFQITELGVKIGKEYGDQELAELETESQFGKLYSRALEYCLMRPHSSREVRDYLYRKSRATSYKSRSGEVKQREGVSQETTTRVFNKLIEKGYIDDEQFARWWVENRNLRKGTSKRKLEVELRVKGVDLKDIETQLKLSVRSDEEELKKVISKKQSRYDDPQKLKLYLLRQGFSYDTINSVLKAKED